MKKLISVILLLLTFQAQAILFGQFAGDGIYKKTHGTDAVVEKPCHLAVNIYRNSNQLQYLYGFLCGLTNEKPMNFSILEGQIYLEPAHILVGSQVGDLYTISWQKDLEIKTSCNSRKVVQGKEFDNLIVPLSFKLRHYYSLTIKFVSDSQIEYSRTNGGEELDGSYAIPFDVGCDGAENFINSQKVEFSNLLTGTLNLVPEN